MSEDRNWEACKIKLELIYENVCEIKEQLKKLNGTVHDHERDIAVLKDWRASQVNTTLGKVNDMRVEIARMGALGTTVGAALGIMLLIGKAVGVF